MPIGLIVIMVLIMGAGVYVIINGNKPRKEANAKAQLKMLKLYKFLSNFFLSSGRMLSITSQLQTMSVYNKNEIYVLASKYYLLSTGVTLGMSVGSIFLFKDVLSILICITFSILVGNVLVDKQIDKTNMIVYRELRKAISHIRVEYMKYGSVAEAIQEAECGDVLKKSFEEIYSILTQSNGELRLHEFYESMPFRPIQTLASVCFNINNSGDSTDKTGQSNFIQALTSMSSDINSELERMVYMKKQFSVIEYLPLIPVVAMKLVESYFMSIMPGTALIYNGPLGYIMKVVVLILCMASYTIISKINKAVPIKIDDRKLWAIKLLKFRFWSRFINNIKDKGVKAEKLNKELKNALSSNTIEHIYTQKVVFAVIAFIISVTACISTVQLGRDYIYNATQQLSLVATDDMDAYDPKDIQEMDLIYMNNEGRMTDEETRQLVQTYMPGLSDLKIIDQQKRLKDKYNSYINAYFRWYYMIACYGCAIIGWLIPNIGLIARKYLVQTEAEDDFLQLQTLMSIIMNTDLDTLDALQQLCQNSRIHKDMLTYCYHCFPSNPEMELVRLQAKTPLLEFKQFIGKLQLTINDLSLREAYDDLMIEREYILKMRDMTIKATIDKKRKMCGYISMVPVIAMVVCSLLIPLGYLGFKEFTSALEMMNS